MEHRFILRDDDIKRRALAHIANCPSDPPLEVIIRPHKENRSLAQNSLLHTMIREIANELGYSEQEMKDILVLKYLGTRTFEYQGQEVETLVETSKLTVQQMNGFLHDVIEFAGEIGVGIRADKQLVREAGL